MGFFRNNASSSPINGAASGDLGGSYPNPTVLSISNVTTGTLPAANGGTAQSTYAKGDIVIASDTNTLSKLTIGSSGKKLTVSAGLPAWI